MKILRTVLLLAAVLLWSAAAEAAVRKSTDKVSVTLYTSQNQINPTQNLGVLIQFVMHDVKRTASFNTVTEKMPIMQPKLSRFPFREAKLSGSGFRGWPAKTNVFRKVSRLNCGFRLPHLI